MAIFACRDCGSTIVLLGVEQHTEAQCDECGGLLELVGKDENGFPCPAGEAAGGARSAQSGDAAYRATPAQGRV